MLAFSPGQPSSKDNDDIVILSLSLDLPLRTHTDVSRQVLDPDS